MDELIAILEEIKETFFSVPQDKIDQRDSKAKLNEFYRLPKQRSGKSQSFEESKAIEMMKNCTSEDDIFSKLGQIHFTFKVNLMFKKIQDCLKYLLIMLYMLKEYPVYYLIHCQEFNSVAIQFFKDFPNFRNEGINDKESEYHSVDKIFALCISNYELERQLIEEIKNVFFADKRNSEIISILFEKNKEFKAYYYYYFDILKLSPFISDCEKIINNWDEFGWTVRKIAAEKDKPWTEDEIALFLDKVKYDMKNPSQAPVKTNKAHNKRAIVESWLDKFQNLHAQCKKKCAEKLKQISYLNEQFMKTGESEKPKSNEYSLVYLETGRVVYNLAILNNELPTVLYNQINSELVRFGHESLIEDIIEISYHLRKDKELYRKALDHRNKRLIRKLENVAANTKETFFTIDDSKYQTFVRILIPLDFLEGLKDLCLCRALKQLVILNAGGKKPPSNKNNDELDEKLSSKLKSLEFDIQQGDVFYKINKYSQALFYYKYVQKQLNELSFQFKRKNPQKIEIFLSERLNLTYDKVSDYQRSIFYGLEYFFRYLEHMKDLLKQVDSLIQHHIVSPILKAVSASIRGFKLEESDSNLLFATIFKKINFDSINKKRALFQFNPINIKYPAITTDNIKSKNALIEKIIAHIKMKDIKWEILRVLASEIYGICINHN